MAAPFRSGSPYQPFARDAEFGLIDAALHGSAGAYGRPLLFEGPARAKLGITSRKQLEDALTGDTTE